MKKQILLSVIFLSVLCALSAQNKPRLAILPFTGGEGGDGETIAELFSFEPEIDQVFTRIPRTSSISAIMKEQQFQRSTGLTDSDTIARLGKQYNADYVVAGHIQKLGASNLVLITIIHVESLQQVAGDYREYRSIEEIQPLIPAMAKRIAQASRIERRFLPKLAVLPFAIPASGVNQNDAEVLAQLIATEMANSGKYAVLPRTSMIQTVMKEHQIQRSDLTEEDNIKKIGQALNAQYVLAGNVRKLGQSNMFTAQILNVENAGLVVGGYENYSAVGDGLSKMLPLGRKLAAIFSIGDTGPAGGIVFYDKGNRNNGWQYMEVAPVETEIIARMSEAVRYCAELNLRGFTGWRLPTINELEMLYKLKGLARFSNSDYWSSSLTNSAYVFLMFKNGQRDFYFGNYNWTESCTVRAVRQF